MTQKFWCHYIGGDDKPKRRSIELTPLAELLPRMNINSTTPLWFERDVEVSSSRTYVYHYLYAQLSDKVAVAVQVQLSEYDIRELLQTDEEINVRCEKVWLRDMERVTTDKERKQLADNRNSWKQAEKDRREQGYERLNVAANFDVYLLSKAQWINMSILRAYGEVQSPLLPTLQTLRKAFEAQREEDAIRCMEEARRRAEEKARKKAEEAAKEYERLDGEAEKFRKGEKIAGEDVVKLCRRYGIAIHLRTIHNLQQVVVEIDGSGTCRYWKQSGKRRPQLDGCYKTAGELYQYLQTH